LLYGVTLIEPLVKFESNTIPTLLLLVNTNAKRLVL
jgi:hypothetical protein